ncbi:hypothetical protein GQ42DRAFT_161319 [Ramicandelaber brevisporus]|nr:hypothetical protein GQ42DRAFT_161319 [Ramicandelaber brevisporus]
MALRSDKLKGLLERHLFVGVSGKPKENRLLRGAQTNIGLGGGLQRPETLLLAISGYEGDGGQIDITQSKPRVLCVTVKRNRKIQLHKVKHDAALVAGGGNRSGGGGGGGSGSDLHFSIVHSWSLDEIKLIESKDPYVFLITLGKTYSYRTEDAGATQAFLQSLLQMIVKNIGRYPRLVGITPTTGAAGDHGDGAGVDGGSAGDHAPGAVAGGAGADGPGAGMNRRDRRTIMMSQRPRTMVAGAGPGAAPVAALPTVNTSTSGGDGTGADGLLFDMDGEEFAFDAADAAGPLDAPDIMLEEAFMLNVDELFTDFGWKASIDAHVLEGRLLKELHSVEAANVKAIIDTETRAADVVAHIDAAIKQLDALDLYISSCITELDLIGDSVRDIQRQNETLKLTERNQKRLLGEMESLLRVIHISDRELRILREASLEQNASLDAILHVAANLQRMIIAPVDDGIKQMAAYRDKMDRYKYDAEAFSGRVLEFLKMMVQYKIDGAQYQQSRPSQVTSMPRITAPDEAREQLVQFDALTRWLREMDSSKDTDLQNVYVHAMAKAYTTQSREMFDSLRLLSARAKSSGAATYDEADYAFAPPMAKGGTGSGSTSNAVTGYVEISRMRPDEAYFTALVVLLPVIIKEQNFFVNMFHLDFVSTSAAATAATSVLPSAATNAENGGITALVPSRPFHVWYLEPTDTSASEDQTAGAPNSDNVPQLHEVRRGDEMKGLSKPRSKGSRPFHLLPGMNKRVQNVMDKIFSGLRNDLSSLVDLALRQDTGYVVSLMAAVESCVHQIEGSDQDFCANLLNSQSKQFNGTFTKFLDEQLRAVDMTKVTVRKRVGLLPFTRTFPKFVFRMEDAMGTRQDIPNTRASVHMAYDRIAKAMFDNLKAIASEADKIDSAVQPTMATDGSSEAREKLNSHILLIENMHHLATALTTNTRRKVPALQPHIDHALTSYETALAAYVRDVIRRPLGRLLEFFEGVEALLRANHSSAAGSGRASLDNDSAVASQIAYNVNYSKASLRKIIAAYSSKEVKRGLEVLLKRVEKHFSATSPQTEESQQLRSTVWMAVKDEMIRQHQRFMGLVRKCYPGADVSLDFAERDLTAWFNELSKSLS